MNSGIVDHDLDGAVVEQFLQRRPRPVTVGDIEGHGDGGPALRNDLGREPIRLCKAALRVHVNVATDGREALAHCSTDAAAAAGDERAYHDPARLASKTTAALPRKTSTSPTRTSNP